MRLIDADALERDGWHMSRTVRIDEKTMEWQTRKPTDFPTVEPQPEQRWIPVTEALPEEDGQYLITVKYKHVNDSYEDIYAEHGEWFEGKWDMFCFGHCGEVEGIIAWMPLPEPYAERRHEGGEE